MIAVVLPCAVTSTYANNFDYMTGINNLTWTKGALRMNHIQVVGTHNSYHVEAPIEEHKVQQKLLQGQAINYWYSHPQLDIQLGDQQVRNLEIDVLADPEGGNYAKPLVRKESKLQYDHDPVWDEPGVKVLHVPDADIHTLCKSLVGCLEIIKGWLDAHPESVPIPIMMELKTAEKRLQDKGGAKVIPWDTVELMDGLDAEIRSVFGPDQLITPDHVRLGNGTLEDSILRFGWPDLESARGRIFFLMDNGPRHIARDTYKQGRPSLQGRVLFTNASPGDADCAFQKASLLSPHLSIPTWYPGFPPHTNTAMTVLAQQPPRPPQQRKHPSPGPRGLLGPHTS